MIDYFRKQGYKDIKADLEGYIRPDEIYGHRPDLTCRTKGFKRIFILLEAETRGTIFDPHTEAQWRAFYNQADQKRGEFHVVVPRICDGQPGRELANQRLRELNISAYLVWMPKK